jgi:hypothetical protein
MTENPMIETPTVESDTADDLLMRIKREMHERLEELRAAVNESDRLRAELRSLEAQPELLREDLGIEDADPEMGEAGPGTEEDATEHSSNVVRLPAARQLPCTPIVSPKVARLMRSCESLSVERPVTPLGKVDAVTARCERAS